MEHRWSPRRKVDRPVRIYHRGEYLGAGMVRDVSKDGVFIEATETALSGGILLDLMSRAKTQEEAVRLSVYVVRVETDGVGAICLGESCLDDLK